MTRPTDRELEQTLRRAAQYLRSRERNSLAVLDIIASDAEAKADALANAQANVAAERQPDDPTH